jgi:hypothetical protein
MGVQTSGADGWMLFRVAGREEVASGREFLSC